MKRIKTYIVNLLRSADRREYILKETAGYPFMDVELVEAVDGCKLSEDETGRLFDREHFLDRYCRIPIAGEIGCTLSHRKCYRKLLESDEEYALILEDDATFLHPEKTASMIEACLKQIVSGRADVILFTSDGIIYKNRGRYANGYSFYPVYMACGTYAYIINRRAADKILKGDKYPSMVADDWRVICRGVSVYAAIPVMIDVSKDFEFTIADRGKEWREYISVRKSRRYMKYRLSDRLSSYYYRLMAHMDFFAGI